MSFPLLSSNSNDYRSSSWRSRFSCATAHISTSAFSHRVTLQWEPTLFYSSSLIGGVIQPFKGTLHLPKPRRWWGGGGSCANCISVSAGGDHVAMTFYFLSLKDLQHSGSSALWRQSASNSCEARERKWTRFPAGGNPRY